MRVRGRAAANRTGGRNRPRLKRNYGIDRTVDRERFTRGRPSTSASRGPHERRFHRASRGNLRANHRANVTNRAIRRLSSLFVILFLVLAARQAYVQIVAAPAIASKSGNPRHALLDSRRGRILATDGTVLAQTSGGKRRYPFGA